MGVDDGDGRRQGPGDVMVVRDQDIDTAPAGLGDLRVARGAAVHGDDEAAASSFGRVDGPQRQAVALLEAARNVRHGVHAESPERERQDRQAGEPVGVEVAEDEDALALRPRPRDAPAKHAGIWQEAGIVEDVLRRGDERVEPGDIGNASSREELDEAR